MLHASVETNVPGEVTLILYSKLDVSWSTPANILRGRKLRVRVNWKGRRLTDKVCEYLIFVTSLSAFMLMRSPSIFVYPLLQLASFSFVFEVLCSFIYYSQSLLLFCYKFFCSRLFFLSDEVYM